MHFCGCVSLVFLIRYGVVLALMLAGFAYENKQLEYPHSEVFHITNFFLMRGHSIFYVFRFLKNVGIIPLFLLKNAFTSSPDLHL